MKNNKLMLISGVGYLLSSLAVVFMPYADIYGQNGSQLLAIISAAVFWAGLIFAVVTQLIAVKKRKHQKDAVPFPLRQRIRSVPVLISALVFVVSLATVIVLTILKVNNFFAGLLIALVLLSIEFIQLLLSLLQPKKNANNEMEKQL